MRIVSLIPRVLNHILQLWDRVPFAHEQHLDVPVATEMVSLPLEFVNVRDFFIAQISGFNASILPNKIG